VNPYKIWGFEVLTPFALKKSQNSYIGKKYIIPQHNNIYILFCVVGFFYFIFMFFLRNKGVRGLSAYSTEKNSYTLWGQKG